MAKCYDFYCEAEKKYFEHWYWHGEPLEYERPCPDCGEKAEYAPSAQFAADNWWAGKQTQYGYFDSKEKYNQHLASRDTIPWEPGLGADAKANREAIKQKNKQATDEKLGKLAQDGFFDSIAYGKR